MKTFVFNEKEYADFKELGLAFAENYASALEAIQTKEFISFVKSNKVYKPIVFDALYESRALQSALTIIIYAFTNEKLIIGGKTYNNIDEIINDLDTNPCVKPFFGDRALRKTILNTIEDEVFKINLKAVEDNYDDEFVYKYLKTYKEADPNVSLYEFNSIFLSSEKFKTAYKLFKDENLLIKLVYRFNLVEVMKIRNAINPVFDGLILVKNEENSKDIKELLQKGFYLGLGKTYNKYKYKSIRALDVLDEVIRKYKKVIKSDDILVHKDFYTSYLKFVELYSKKEIVVKKKYADYDYNIPYCDAYVNNNIVSKYGLKEFDEAKDDVTVPCYNLKRLSKAVKQHKGYIRWNIAVIIISVLLYVATYFIPYLTPGFNGVFGIFDFVLFGALAGVLALTILIGVKNKNDEKRYNDLCKLNYYRKNYNLLTLKQKEDMERIKLLEDKHSIKSDHHYFIIGAVVNSCLAITASLMTMIILINAVPLLDEGFIKVADLLRSFYTPTNTYKPIDPHAFVMPAIASTLPMFVGIIRHKKTAMSCILSVLFGFVITLVLGFVL